MGNAIQPESALSQLQSQAQVELLDAVDRLRLDGFHGELDVPQLIVCGDQSSGKSSVLEAISGVRFPAKDVFCTHFATELVLRRAVEASFDVEIRPARHRTDDQRRYLEDFTKPEGLTKPEHSADVIDAASKHIRSLDDDGFSEDKLVLVIRGPDLPPLTLVDLPGIIHASNKEQGDRDIDTARRIVESYMAMPSSIILAVLAADNNFANQVVLQMAKQVDPEAKRTLGIITKPDRCPAGSQLEASCIEHAQNLGVYLDLGWHVLRNRSFDDGSCQAEERNMREAEFFRRPTWAALPRDLLGVVTLRDKLRRILLQTLRRGLPKLVQEIQQRIFVCETKLRLLGQPKVSEMEQRMQLTTISQNLRQLLEAGISGNYLSDLSNSPAIHGSSDKRLRAGLQKLLAEFAKEMRETGHTFALSEQDPASSTLSIDFASGATPPTGGPIKATRQQILLAIDAWISANQGCELPGLCPPSIVADVFKTLSGPWQTIAKRYTSRCYSMVTRFFTEMLEEAAPSHVADAVMQRYAEDALETLSKQLDDKIEELLRPYRRGHLITANQVRLLSMVGAGVEVCHSELQSQQGHSGSGETVRQASRAETVLSYASAYYDIALDTFTDNVANLAVEDCLVDKVTQIFAPVTVAGLDAEAVQYLTLEPPAVLRDRAMNEKRLATLKQILKVCIRHSDRFDGQADPKRGRAAIVEAVTPQDTTVPAPAIAVQSSHIEPLQVKASPHRYQRPDEALRTPPETPQRTLRAEDFRRDRSRGRKSPSPSPAEHSASPTPVAQLANSHRARVESEEEL